jgi:nicotinamide mononucleotide transporter
VWLSKKENVWLYPVGLVSTAIYTVQSFQNQLLGEASVNFYYTIMSILGWYWWLRKDDISKKHHLHIGYSTKKELMIQFIAFLGLFAVIFILLTYAKNNFYPGVIPWADGFATATAFTGMYLMVRKKVESWYWWLATNAASIPLYNVKGMKPTVLYYSILLVLAVLGLLEWKKKAINTKKT